MLKRFPAAKKTKDSQNWSPKCRFFRNLRVYSSYQAPQQALPYLERLLRKNPFRGVGCSLIEEPPKNEKKTSHPRHMAKSRIWGTESPELITTKFCMPGAIHDIVMHANFGEDRLRGFSVAKGRILAFSTDLLHCLYNTLALPCECVIIRIACVVIQLYTHIQSGHNSKPPPKYQ